MRFALLLFVCLFGSAAAQDLTYQKPPKEIVDVLNAPLPPAAYPDPTGSTVLLGQVRRYPSIADVAEPYLGLAGVRFNPSTNAQQMLSYLYAFTLKNLSTGQETRVSVPPNARLAGPIWSPDGKTFLLVNTTTSGDELLLGDAASGKLRRVPGLQLNGLLTGSLWWSTNNTILVKAVPASRGKPPSRPTVPAGPIVQEAKGQSGPVRTLQDMLQSPQDERLFDYYFTSQLAWLDVGTLKLTPIGEPAIYTTAIPSPNGQLINVTRMRRPYSYLHFHTAFPRDVEVWDRSGRSIYTVAKLPLQDKVPIDGVATGRRSIAWFSTEPATLTWVEALDDGDPRKKVPHRDRVVRFRAPFQGEPVELTRTEHRFMGLAPIEKSTLAFLTDFDRDRRWTRTVLLDVSKPGDPVRKEVWSRSIRDRYKDPGSPMMAPLAGGRMAVRQDSGSIFLEGPGGTPQGDRPFLDRMSLSTLKTDRIFQSGANEYESVLALASNDGGRYITRHESPSAPPNFFLRTADGEKRAITNFADPTPQLRRIRKQLVRYKRPDGVDLSFTLYLPADYIEGTRLPTVIAAYPLEFTDPGVAGQVVGSPQRFTTLSGYTHLFYVLAGYAVMDGASMPVVGDPETVNNTYIEQISASAKAAIDKGVEMGVTDPQRVGVIGHSYGAFMTANLLAHTDLFKAGVARSGAYNRTLTPFGFQSERRTYWEAAETYMGMSPFNYAHKIKEPLLLIHGQADNNPGTFPVQSERMYQAVRGNGGTVRLVMLPHESHGYQARESVEHTLWEMITWFDKYVKAQ